ncbi:MAG: cupin domain-containing protein [Bacteroidota bacterium]
MQFKSLSDVVAFTAGDLTEIKELLHPEKDKAAINYSLAHATLAVGASSTPHILKESSELYFILEGTGKAFIGTESKLMEAGDFVLIPAGEKQYIENTGTVALKFLCVVSPPWSKEQEVIL